jgi:hypothetical protein
VQPLIPFFLSGAAGIDSVMRELQAAASVAHRDPVSWLRRSPT